MKKRERVILESPYAGDVVENAAYARRALKDSLSRNEAPIASHLLYTQVLDDNDPKERLIGIEAGLSWIVAADLMAVYFDRGFSKGVLAAIEDAAITRLPVALRSVHVPILQAFVCVGKHNRCFPACDDLGPFLVGGDEVPILVESAYRQFGDFAPRGYTWGSISCSKCGNPTPIQGDLE